MCTRELTDGHKKISILFYSIYRALHMPINNNIKQKVFAKKKRFEKLEGNN